MLFRYYLTKPNPRTNHFAPTVETTCQGVSLKPFPLSRKPFLQTKSSRVAK